MNWKGKLRRALWLLKIKGRIKVQKQKKFLKPGNNILNNTSIRNLLMMKISYIPFLTPQLTAGIESSTKEHIITKKSERKTISSLKNNEVPGPDLITAKKNYKLEENQ